MRAGFLLDSRIRGAYPFVVIPNTGGVSVYDCAACHYDKVSISRLVFVIIIPVSYLLTRCFGTF